MIRVYLQSWPVSVFWSELTSFFVCICTGHVKKISRNGREDFLHPSLKWFIDINWTRLNEILNSMRSYLNYSSRYQNASTYTVQNFKTHRIECAFKLYSEKTGHSKIKATLDVQGFTQWHDYQPAWSFLDKRFLRKLFVTKFHFHACPSNSPDLSTTNISDWKSDINTSFQSSKTH